MIYEIKETTLEKIKEELNPILSEINKRLEDAKTIKGQADEVDLPSTADVSGTDQVDLTKLILSINDIEGKVNRLLEVLRQEGILIT